MRPAKLTSASLDNGRYRRSEPRSGSAHCQRSRESALLPPSGNRAYGLICAAEAAIGSILGARLSTVPARPRLGPGHVP
jgi:hypothetical protein